MGLSTTPCDEFIEVLASKAPAPGGGSATALVGAIGTALGNMVGSLTVGKKKYAAVEDRMYELMERSAVLEKELLALIEKDEEVLLPMLKVYSMPSATEKEKAEKEKAMEAAFRNACSVPLEIMEKCCEALELIREFALKGSAMLISDAGTGAVFCKAAIKSAALNVYVNTKPMKDRAYAESLNARADSMLETYSAMADEIYENISEKMR